MENIESSESTNTPKSKRRKTWAIIIYVIIGVGVIGTIGKKLETASKVNDFQTWSTLESKDFLIKYPSNWIVDSTSTEYSDYTLLPKPIKDIDLEQDGVFTIKKAYNEMAELSLNEQSIRYKNDVLQTLQNAEILEIDTGINNSHKYIKIAYLATVKLKVADAKLKSITYFILKNDLTYGLAYGCEPEQFDKNIRVYNRIFSSFSLK